MKNNLAFKAISKGFNMPMLPSSIYNIYNNIFIRIFRVIG